MPEFVPDFDYNKQEFQPPQKFSKEKITKGKFSKEKALRDDDFEGGIVVQRAC